jgi:uncharacterized protein involved in exopolysaccharide biosynthesis
MKFGSKKVLGFVGLIIGFSLGGLGLWLLLSPLQYQAVVRVQWGRDTGGYDPYDPYFFQTALETVRSDLVLSNVVGTLNLFEDWDGQKIGVTKAIRQLKGRTTVQPARKVAYVFEICVIDKKPETAARIANAIAGVYCDYRIENIRRERARGLEILEDEYQKETTDIKVQKENFGRLKGQLGLANQGPAEAMAEPSHFAYTQAEHSLTNEEAIHHRREAIIASLKSHDNSRAALVSEFGIRIVDPAVLPSVPIGPNRWLGAALLICGLSVSISGGYLMFIGGPASKR